MKFCWLTLQLRQRNPSIALISFLSLPIRLYNFAKKNKYRYYITIMINHCKNMLRYNGQLSKAAYQMEIDSNEISNVIRIAKNHSDNLSDTTEVGNSCTNAGHQYNEQRTKSSRWVRNYESLAKEIFVSGCGHRE